MLVEIGMHVSGWFDWNVIHSLVVGPIAYFELNNEHQTTRLCHIDILYC